MQWARLMQSRAHELRLLIHIPNGGSRHQAEAARLKAAGVRRGVPDLLLPVPMDGYHGLWIELKAHGGRVRPEQREWIEALSQHGYRAVVCTGASEAIEELMRYLSV